MFLSKYYDVLEKHPKYLHHFYKEESTFTVTEVGDDQRSAKTETAQGSMEVRIGPAPPAPQAMVDGSSDPRCTAAGHPGEGDGHYPGGPSQAAAHRCPVLSGRRRPAASDGRHESEGLCSRVPDP